MKRTLIPLLVIATACGLFTGCSWQVGGGEKHSTVQPTMGQQLVDLQRARDSGAITEGEYQSQKTKLLAK